MVCAPWLWPPHQNSRCRTSRRPHAVSSEKHGLCGHVLCPTPSITVARGGNRKEGGRCKRKYPRTRSNRRREYHAKVPFPDALAVGGMAGLRGAGRGGGGVYAAGQQGGCPDQRPTRADRSPNPLQPVHG